jgi:hypothetical protein
MVFVFTGDSLCVSTYLPYAPIREVPSPATDHAPRFPHPADSPRACECLREMVCGLGILIGDKNIINTRHRRGPRHRMRVAGLRRER